jgi:DNA-binding NarL/FixJ family response regulator
MIAARVAGSSDVTRAAGTRRSVGVHRLPHASTARALLAAASELVEADPHTPVVVICRRSDLPQVRSLLAAGVRGVVLEHELEAALEPTVAAVAAGQVCVPGDHAGSLAPPLLSVREKQVVGLAAMGLSNREIAERMFLAESTIKSHMSSAFVKLGVRSRHEATDLIVNRAWGIGLGILSIDAEPVRS